MKTPYYAVIFTSIRVNETDDYYAEMAIKMEELAKQQEGFLGVETARNEIGITISYWKDQNSIKNWKHNLEHLEAQKKGISDWYESYTLRIALVEKAYSFTKSE